MNSDIAPGLVSLHVAFPKSIEEDVLDVCRSVPNAPGFTVIAAEGLGVGAQLRTARETVLGRAQRRLLVIVAAPDVCARVVVALREALPSPEATYWILPVVEFGRLA